MEAKLGKSVSLNIVEVRSPDLNAQLVAENIAQQLEKRVSFRRAKMCIRDRQTAAPTERNSRLLRARDR